MRFIMESTESEKNMGSPPFFERLAPVKSEINKLEHDVEKRNYQFFENEKFENAQIIQDLGFIIGLHTKKISYKQLNFIHDNFFMIDKI